MGISQNKSEIRDIFSDPKNDRLNTTICHDSTTDLPSKNHAQSPVFAKTPSKAHKSPRKK